MASIHQINHPGKDLVYPKVQRNRSSNRYKYTDQSSGVCFATPSEVMHLRKFIEHNGTYLTHLNAPPKTGAIRFWGEYEGETHFEHLPDSLKPYYSNPQVVHRIPKNSVAQIHRNTDPYVFGNEILYAFCLKDKLQNLNKGDLILFGSEFGGSKYSETVSFYLDTLLVVGEDFKYPSQESKLSVEYKQKVLTPHLMDVSECGTLLENINCVNKHCNTEYQTAEIHIHKGRGFIEAEPYSFVPCRPIHNSENPAFGRPIIDTVALGLRKPGARQGAFSRNGQTESKITAIWHTVVKSVLDQGFALGVSIEGTN